MSNFPDLMGSDEDSIRSENFWPSLTDIMMVVVMIFLISTATLIIKNWSLVRDLTQTAEAERQAKQKIRATTLENMTLEERVAALESMLSDMQLKEMRTKEQKQALQERVNSLLEKLARSTNLSTSLEEQLKQKTAEIQDQLKRLATIENELKQVSDEFNQQQQALNSTRENLDSTASELMAKTDALAEANKVITSMKLAQKNQQDLIDSTRNTMELSEENLARLRDEYARLESKYNKLVRPARTTKGKIIVSARYQKIDGQDQYAIRTPDSHRFEVVDEATLHRELAALKARFGNKLYVRIVFPDDNGLSYQEAYGFTNDILTKYDYYRQETAADKAKDSSQ
ncbi:MAG TPA: hypothetical protein ENJ35_07690 [Gammaproteobacteria bacterium]|nr:hypothetical protein [Gammaproteobacteria bacterium]